MEHSNDEPIPYLRELRNEIETNSEKWTSETIDQAQQRLSSLTSRLNKIRNSRLSINKLSPDILYIIFTLAVYPHPNLTILGISHVCHHWRESLLRWPVLWAFVDLDSPPLITNLFVKRSQNAPLRLSWITHPDRPVSFNDAPSKSYLVSHAKSILSRLCSLVVAGTYSNFISLHHVIRKSKLPPLELQYLTVILFPIDGFDEEKPEVPPLTPLINGSYLQEIELYGLALPWLEFSHNKLTRLMLNHSTNPPPLSQLLTLLSNCPFLRDLDLSVQDYDDFGTETVFAPTTSTSLQAITKLDFPHLTRFKLEALGHSSYDYIWQLASHIRTLGTLSLFKLTYDLSYFGGSSDETTAGDTDSTSDNQHKKPFQILGAVAPGTFSHFSKYQYLVLDFEDGEDVVLGVRRDTSCRDHKTPESDSPEYPFFIMHKGLEPLQIDHSPIIQLIYSALPGIRHLIMKNQAWKIFTFPNFDARRAFPCLHTLALTVCGPEALTSFPADLRVKTLFLLSCTVSFSVLYDVVVSTEAESLEFKECYDIDDDDDNEGLNKLISGLQRRGVDVVWDEPDEESESSEESVP